MACGWRGIGEMNIYFAVCPIVVAELNELFCGGDLFIVLNRVGPIWCLMSAQEVNIISEVNFEQI